MKTIFRLLSVSSFKMNKNQSTFYNDTYFIDTIYKLLFYKNGSTFCLEGFQNYLFRHLREQ
jgi:hypothetical protein